MNIFTKILFAYLVLITAVCFYFSYESHRKERQLEKIKQETLWKEFSKNDSTRNAEYVQWKNRQEKQLDVFLDSLNAAHSQTVVAIQKASQARSKSLKAYEERKAIHLHPDSLPLF